VPSIIVEIGSLSPNCLSVLFLATTPASTCSAGLQPGTLIAGNIKLYLQLNRKGRNRFYRHLAGYDEIDKLLRQCIR
jgi:hypothetical protein